MEGGWEGGSEGEGATSTMLVFYFYATQNNIMWPDTIGLHTFYGKKVATLLCKRSPFRRYS